MRTGAIARLAAALCLVAGGCLADPLMELGATDPLLEDCATTAFVQEELRLGETLKVDILVVVDNSMSMAEEQANLANNFPKLIRSLLDPPVDPETGRREHAPLTDMHIGVVSTDMGTAGYPVETCRDSIDGDDGILLNEPHPAIDWCADSYDEFLSYESGEPDVEAIDRLARDFGCLSVLGMDGCGFEQPLKAAVRAIAHADGGPNEGFLRPDSILTILFITDEEDCSVAPGHEGIFDTLDSSLGHLNLRCYNHPYMITPVEEIAEAFMSMREDPEKLVVAFIGGVPPGPECEGFGDTIPDCLAHPAMQERIDPVSMTRLVPACFTSTGQANAGRRFVRLAQHLGASAYVQSICTDDFRPAIEGLTSKLRDVIDCLRFWKEFPTGRDPDEPCRCETSCQLVEMLDDDRVCPEGKPCLRSGGPGNGCRIDWVDGEFGSLCVIPQIGTRTVGCDPSAPGQCGDTDVAHAPDLSRGSGWYYMGHGWTAEGGHTYRKPNIEYTDGMSPDAGSRLFIRCETCLGPPRLTPVTGGEIGTPCSPETCPPYYAPEGDLIEGRCGWEPQETYIAEAEECLGGACLVFRHEEGLYEPYCSRRCGRSGGGECPGGYKCISAFVDESWAPGCYCVDEDQLNLEPGSGDIES
ncbi:MAG: hypothetical protein JRG91_19995, partial [Deltaproteobacteria bacterium]|nr:hypothetical protein [Deltaproteobacteria bacterium]